MRLGLIWCRGWNRVVAGMDLDRNELKVKMGLELEWGMEWV